MKCVNSADEGEGGTFVQRCPEAIKPHIPAIEDLCLKYITYDPNYNYDADEGEGGFHMETKLGGFEEPHRVHRFYISFQTS